MIGLIDFFIIYCSVIAHVCVQERPTLDQPLLHFSECEAVGRAGDPDFADTHTDFRLIFFICAIQPGIKL